jgi:hypothetical protein
MVPKTGQLERGAVEFSPGMHSRAMGAGLAEDS